YDRGTLEITVPLENHEFALRLIERFIIILVVEMGMKVKTMGPTTMDREKLNCGSEPDCAYYIQNQPLVASREVKFDQDPSPDLVVEVDITHTDIDKNRLYAAMEISEFWRYDGLHLRIFQLQDGAYQERESSPTFEWVKKDDPYQFLAEAEHDEVNAEVNFCAYVQEKIKVLQILFE
ncbi:MAG: Uma2 family endonuclease, partial [Cyanobacteria bacterium P01_D01_bin.73]